MPVWDTPSCQQVRWTTVWLVYNALNLRPTFFSAGVGLISGWRNSSESRPGSKGSPQLNMFWPGIRWRVTNDHEDSDDQGSAAGVTTNWVILTNQIIEHPPEHWKSHLQASVLLTISSSKSTNPVQLEGETSPLPSVEPVGWNCKNFPTVFKVTLVN